MFYNELALIDEIWVDPIFAGPMNPQGSEKKNQKRVSKRQSKKR